jgi:nitrate/TMAO reductase-like tetraheme cytochrome c subunit
MHLIVIYATRFCVNWAFLIAREARLKYERSEDFKASCMRMFDVYQKCEKRVVKTYFFFVKVSCFQCLQSIKSLII